jgi:NADP-dependent aldehyde dehydrogenase
MRAAQARREPVPFYAEMSSVNPVLVLPAALASRGASIAQGFVNSLTMGAGQFCTNPGLVLAAEGRDTDAFEAEVAKLLPASPAATMLTAGICEAYGKGVARLAAHPKVRSVARGEAVASGHGGQAAFFAAQASDFIADPALQEEVFGASSVLVRCDDARAMRGVLEKMEGQLTITLQMDPEDHAMARELLPLLERKADRGFLETAQDGKAKWIEAMNALASPDRDPIQPQYLMSLIDQHANDDAILNSDSGTIRLDLPPAAQSPPPYSSRYTSRSARRRS